MVDKNFKGKFHLHKITQTHTQNRIYIREEARSERSSWNGVARKKKKRMR